MNITQQLRLSDYLV